ncbi:hypothetical protein FHS42_002526 [Streptomyces zagrosensis]|uniref:Uncharacterized protein n=1 Tax=Streptomyces zagrosensis TaxID=1042984 RepID=A0A7W9Q8B4_9ACTN|nr:hypothetical protein [Streptomyces zagrosensis]
MRALPTRDPSYAEPEAGSEMTDFASSRKCGFLFFVIRHSNSSEPCQ